MRQLTTKPFPYFVGLYSLEELVTKKSKVCVINILGGESRVVTPVSHEYSNGNVVAGVQYGRRGVLETNIGSIPVYRSLRDVMEHGIAFDIGVIYLPPMAVSQAVWELVSYNKDLKRIVIITEKVPVRDSRNARFICQEAGVDVVGANCLGVANVWDHVRVGGALGGDRPEETLKKGSIAIHSNSGNFTTTIAEYLRTSGFGVSTAVSSGKDVYIHFALPEFLFAAQNDPRTKAVAVYVEPGGYYEKQALEWIEERLFNFTKPIVVCVTGRWKKDVVRSCGHAGAMAGSGDDAESKEKWFDDYFGIGIFNPRRPKVGKRGVRVSSIQQIPEAMHAVFKMLGESPDFEKSGDLSLKVWIKDNFVSLPKELDIPMVPAMPPYDQQIAEINRQVGAHYLRQNMRNKSGASRMDPVTQVSELHGRTILDLSKNTFQENVYFALSKVMPQKHQTRMLNLLLNLFLKVDQRWMAVINAARENGCTPNEYVASPLAAIGNSVWLAKIRSHAHAIIEKVREYEVTSDTVEWPKDLKKWVRENCLTSESQDPSGPVDLLLKEFRQSVKHSDSLAYSLFVVDTAGENGLSIRDPFEFLLASAAVSLFWKPMMEKRITREFVEESAVYLRVIAQIVAYSVIDPEANGYWKSLAGQSGSVMHSEFTQNIFRILFNRKPSDTELVELRYLLGLTITNGPGTISAKGAKESVSARNTVSMSFVGFLCNTGLAHGGNGFESVQYLMDQFKNSTISDPGEVTNESEIKKLAVKAAKTYAEYKKAGVETLRGTYDRIPCIGHPVFKGNEVNLDPREDFVRKELEALGIHNAFLSFYHALVHELFNEGVTKNVFAVNVDAVLAVITLKLIWSDLREGKIGLQKVQDLVFALFILGRSIGVAAEIADHRDRGLDMDCRTPQKEISFVL